MDRTSRRDSLCKMPRLTDKPRKAVSRRRQSDQSERIQEPGSIEKEILAGWESDSDLDYESELSDADSRAATPEDRNLDLYQKACRRLNSIPATCVARSLHTRSLVLRYRGLSANDLKAICLTMLSNTTVTHLDLTGNDIDDKGAGYVAETISENVYITHLALVENKITAVGTGYLCGSLLKNMTVKSLLLSGNRLGDSGAIHLTTLLQETTQIEDLDVSNNSLGPAGAVQLAQGIANNDSVKKLDLSWNHIRLEGAWAVCKALEVNDTLRNVNLNCNGLCIEGCEALGQSFARNTTLEEIDLENNRIELNGLKFLLRGLESNSTIKCLKIGNNPFGTRGATAIIDILISSEKSALQHLDLTRICVDEEFTKKVNSLPPSSALRVVHDVISRNKNGTSGGDSEEYKRRDPLYIISQYVANKHLRLVDVFREFDEDNSNTISKSELKTGVKGISSGVTDAEVLRAAAKLDLNKDGEIDYSEFVQGQKSSQQNYRQSATPAGRSQSMTPL